jgi:hypothetical protein
MVEYSAPTPAPLEVIVDWSWMTVKLDIAGEK